MSPCAKLRSGQLAMRSALSLQQGTNFSKVPWEQCQGTYRKLNWQLPATQRSKYRGCQQRPHFLFPHTLPNASCFHNLLIERADFGFALKTPSPHTHWAWGTEALELYIHLCVRENEHEKMSFLVDFSQCRELRRQEGLHGPTSRKESLPHCTLDCVHPRLAVQSYAAFHSRRTVSKKAMWWSAECATTELVWQHLSHSAVDARLGLCQEVGVGVFCGQEVGGQGHFWADKEGWQSDHLF